jgi:hypothetical protein
MGLPLHASGASGIWLLLAVLERLGLAAWLDAHGTAIDAGLPQRILSAICRQVGVVPDDAVWRELEVAAVDHALGTGADPAVEAMVTDWCMRVETWCVGTAGIDLGAIVLRRGWLHTTRTHVDIYFDLADVDVRTRRAGLDFDPGWVPWLGRVVTFFYEAGLAAIPL